MSSHQATAGSERSAEVEGAFASEQLKPDTRLSHRSTVESQNIDRDQSSDSDPGIPDLVLQLETRSVTQEQLINYIRSIYKKLVPVEKQCIDSDEAQTKAFQANEPGPNKEQWHTQIILHRTLLYQYYDFYFSSQNPSVDPILRKLAANHAMLIRMWRHGIYSFLEVLRHRLPESYDHMVFFIFSAYSIITVLYEAVPTYENIWMEWLGDLGRYRMAIEDSDVREHKKWTKISRFWYSKIIGKNPNIGRLYHHLAILARPMALQQFYLYTRSLTCVQPFQATRENILTLLNPILESDGSSCRLQALERTFIRTHAIIFTERSNDVYTDSTFKLMQLFDDYIIDVTGEFKEQMTWIAIANHAAFFEYGVSNAIFTQAYNQRLSDQPTQKSFETIGRASILSFGILSRILLYLDDSNVHDYLHITLVFLDSLTLVEKAMKLIESYIPWDALASYLNTLLISEEAVFTRVQKLDSLFPQSEGPLPEDYIIRGQIWAQWYFPDNWFDKNGKRQTEETESRLERIMYLAFRIASFKKWLIYDNTSQRFSVSHGTDQLADELGNLKITTS
ncbi:MAG: hypothetical protein M1834_000919 [Cirrosporium novae-zelandiae]|nr:MAG: hypothetical protein M1834_000919 [Cirrosporium novae-zelandiae]